MTSYDLQSHSQFAIVPSFDSCPISTPPPEYQRVDPRLNSAQEGSTSPIYSKEGAHADTVTIASKPHLLAPHHHHTVTASEPLPSYDHGYTGISLRNEGDVKSPIGSTKKFSATRKPMDQWACYYNYRACAFLTARKSLNILRDPSSRLCDLLESKPLAWSDAAAPLLAQLRNSQNVTIYESSVPCSVPHICITEPLSVDDFAPWDNAAPQQVADDGRLLSLIWTPRALSYYSIGDEDWYTSADFDTGFIDDLDFAFDDDDYDFDLPSPDRAETPSPITPPPYTVGSWREDTSLVSPTSGANALSEESTLSPTAGESMPMLFVQGTDPSFPRDFPDSIDHDGLFSPTSPVVSRKATYNGWDRSIASMIMGA